MFVMRIGERDFCNECSIIPEQYVGWVFLIFTIVAFIAIFYGLYLISTDPKLENQND